MWDCVTQILRRGLSIYNRLNHGYSARISVESMSVRVVLLSGGQTRVNFKVKINVPSIDCQMAWPLGLASVRDRRRCVGSMSNRCRSEGSCYRVGGRRQYLRWKYGVGWVSELTSEFDRLMMFCMFITLIKCSYVLNWFLCCIILLYFCICSPDFLNNFI